MIKDKRLWHTLVPVLALVVSFGAHIRGIGPREPLGRQHGARCRGWHRAHQRLWQQYDARLR